MNSPRMIMVFTFMGVVAVLFGVSSLVSRFLTRNSDRVSKRLAEEFGEPEPEPFVAFKLLERLAAKVDAEGPPGMRRRFVTMVEHSGLNVTPSRLLQISASLGLAVAAGIGLWRHSVVISFFAGLIAALIPIFYAQMLQKARNEKLLEQLPEILDLISRFLRVGHSLPQALRSVASEFKAPAGPLFAACVSQQELGLPSDVALRKLADTVALAEYRIVVLAILVQQQTGGMLAEVCERLAIMVRERFRVQGMIVALTADGRMQAKILMVLPLVIFLAMMVLKRDYANALLAQPKLLAAIIVSQAIGYFWIRRIVNVSF